MTDENSGKPEPFELYLGSPKDGERRRYLRIKFRDIDALLQWPEGPESLNNLTAFSTVFEHIIKAARSEMDVRDSLRDLDREITDLLSPKEDDEE